MHSTHYADFYNTQKMLFVLCGSVLIVIVLELCTGIIRKRLSFKNLKPFKTLSAQGMMSVAYSEPRE